VELLEGPDLEAGLNAALAYALDLSSSARGNIQLIDWNAGHLTIAAHHGFDSEFLGFFKHVSLFDGTACGRAALLRAQIIVEDMIDDERYIGIRPMALRSGFRGVQSTPLISRSGAFVGVLSTHFPRPHRPTKLELTALMSFGRVVADKIILHRVLAASALFPLTADEQRLLNGICETAVCNGVRGNGLALLEQVRMCRAVANKIRSLVAASPANIRDRFERMADRWSALADETERRHRARTPSLKGERKIMQVAKPDLAHANRVSQSLERIAKSHERLAQLKRD
jgi:hypothetical protein